MNSGIRINDRSGGSFDADQLEKCPVKLSLPRMALNKVISGLPEV
jgi:hypothetical protein